MQLTRLGNLHQRIKEPWQYIGCKPGGGLWFSPGAEWLDKCEEDYPGEIARPITTITLLPTARIFKVDSHYDLVDLEQEYGIPADIYEHYFPVGINWEVFVKDWDGLWVTENALTNPDNFQEDRLNLYAWDVESVVLFNNVWL